MQAMWDRLTPLIAVLVPPKRAADAFRNFVVAKGRSLQGSSWTCG